MTSLQITPTFERKTARIVGTIAAGEHVSVTIVGGNAVKTSTLYLRIVCGGKTIAQFPKPVDEGETPETWTTSGDNITAILDLNTVEALNYCRTPQTGCLAVLEDLGDSTATPAVHPQLYFVSDCLVNCWPQKRVNEEPYSLDAYPGLISQWTTMISNLSATVTKAGGVTTITIVNKDGTTTTAQVLDGTTPTWSDLSGKPSVFPPAGHQHGIADVQNLSSELMSKADSDDVSEAIENEISARSSGDSALANSIAAAIVRIASVESGKQNNLSQAQLSAVNSGIDSSKVSKIAENTAEISSVRSTVASKLDSSKVGANNGVAELDSGGKVPASQLPSYVDDVVEYPSASGFPNPGESGKIYIAKDTNITYRWGGSSYVKIGSDLALGETSSTAYRGDRGKTAYDHSQDGSSHVTEQQKSDWNGKQDALEYDAQPVQNSTKMVRSGGIWSWVKSLLPSWLTSNYAEPATVSSVNAKYTKPSGGIPGTDLNSDVQVILGSVSGKLDANTANYIASVLVAGGNSVTFVYGDGTEQYFTPDQPDITVKADKVTSSTNGNFAGLNSSGNLTDSGKKPSDFQTALSAAQLNAANSGITAQKLTDLEKRGYFAIDEHGNIYAVIPDQN